MKVLVTVKRVEDPEVKIKIRPDGLGIDTSQMKYVVNPFDEIAVEEALRIRDTSGGGEIVVVSLGVADAVTQLRTALAMGADRAIHVVTITPLDSLMTARALAQVVAQEQPDLVLLGKQAIDDDAGQVGIMLAEKLGWAQVSFASKEAALDSEDEKNKKPAFVFEGGRVTCVREVDGGLETLSAALPAVITTELRLNVPRYASLPGIMKAKKKEVKVIAAAELIGDATPGLVVRKLAAPKSRKAGQIVPDVDTLIAKLKTEAKVI